MNFFLSILMLLLLTDCSHPKGTAQLTDGKGYVEMEFKVPFVGSIKVVKMSSKEFIERSMVIEKTKFEIRDRFGKKFLYQNRKPRNLKEIETDPRFRELSSYEKDCFKLWYWDEVIKNTSEFESLSIKECNRPIDRYQSLVANRADGI